MKNRYKTFMAILLCALFIFPMSTFAENEKPAKRDPSVSVRPIVAKHTKPTPYVLVPGTPGTGLRRSIAYGNDLWAKKLYSFDVDTPSQTTIIDTAEYVALCGDFAPGDPENMWIIDAQNNTLKMVNINSGQATFVADFPVPTEGAVWTSLSIQKSTRQFYAIVVDSVGSILYSFDPENGIKQPELDLGLEAVISSAFDATGTLYIFDIQSDSTFTVDIQNGLITALGGAGFDGNYAQGMAYDSQGDEIYLAAYEDFVGPQLRKLNRLTGSTTHIAALAGETGAFGFPSSIQVSGIDFGDAPEAEVGIMTFPTTLSKNGAAHNIDPNIFLGEMVDGEPDGQPDPDALGDDNDLIFPSLGDDEDGVELPKTIFPDTEVSLNVKASVNGFLDAWIDFDVDGNWFNPNEHIFTMQPLIAGNNTLTFIVPATATPGKSYARFRFRDDPSPLSFDGFANNGEVEDYALMIEKNTTEGWDFGDAPQEDGVFNYPTLLANDGARHFYVPGIHLGNYVDVETNGQPTPDANGDDTDKYYPSLGDDEDGVILPDKATPGSKVSLSVTASVSGFLDAWMDFDLDGNWAGSGEHIFETYPLNPGANALSFTIPATASSGKSYLRFRFRDNQAPLSFSGIADNGEVEDYVMQIVELPAQGWDFGDAPDGIASFMFPSLFSSNGARHRIHQDIYLGNMVDAEPNGQPAISALGDDNDLIYPSMGDDEDGISFTSQIVRGQTASIEVVASIDGYLDAWMDFDADGSWTGTNEHIFVSQVLSAGLNNLTFNIPASSATGTSYVRFRFRDYDAPISFDGEMDNGEVEDYKVEIQSQAQPAMDFGDAPESDVPFFLSYPTTRAKNGAAHIIESNIFLGNFVDAEPNGQPDSNAKGDDLDIFYPSLGDDEDGVTLPETATAGSTVEITVVASVDGYLDAWMDFNLDNSWLSPDEHIFTIQAVAAGTNTLLFTIPTAAIAGKSYLRFRFRDYESPISFDGLAQNGEVEDYTMQIVAGQATGWDFGDAPGEIYPTLLENDGARHVYDGLTFLGNLLDTENDALQSADAKGDNLDNLNDEDGVQFVNAMYVGGIATVQVRASVEAYLNAWIDFEKDGSWADAGDQVFADQWLTAGINTLSFAIPLTASSGNTFMRFRFSTQEGLGFTGLAENGEVEDYQVSVYPEWYFVPTFSTHIISVPSNLQNLQTGDMLGVFFISDDGQEQCAGTMIFNQNQSGQMLAYGDDEFTPEVKEGFATGELILWKLFSVEYDSAFDVSVSYNPNFPNNDGLFAPFGLSELSHVDLEPLECDLPTDWQYSITGQIHSINIPLSANPTIEGEPLSNGDWLGVFYLDDDDEDACGGAVHWDGAASVVITAYGDDPFTTQKDGFAAGEAFRWKIYDCDKMEASAATAGYNQAMPCQGNFGSFCLSELVSLQTMMLQNVSLFTGWNSISTYLIPDDPNVKNMFAPQVDQLVIIQNLSSLYWPYAGVNTIGSWDNESGYAIKVSEDFDKEFKGAEFVTKEITLGAGWHYLPVLSSCPVSANDVFSAHSDKITLVQDIIGTNVWWPAMNVYSLQTLLPGKAYKIRTTGEITLMFPDCAYKSGHSKNVNDANHISSPWGNINMTPLSHLVSVFTSKISDFEKGDYMGAFDQSDNLFGLVENQNTNQNLVMTLFGDDPTTEEKDGFYENEVLTFRLMKSSTGNEIPLEVTFDYSLPNPEQVFNNQGISAVASITAILSRPGHSDLHIYPNPSTGIVNIDGLNENSTIELFNAFGERVSNIEMHNSNQVDLSDLQKGIYFLNITAKARVYFEKVIVQ